MENRINVKIKQCYDTEENYKINNPVLLSGQLAYTKDRYGKYKIGDGISHWNDLGYTDNIFIGTQKEYEEKNAAGEIRPGTIVYITDDNDYCNITIDKELSENSQNLVENQAVAKALKINETKDNTVIFNEADRRENINTGEKHSVIFGKIKKYLNDLKDVAFSNSYNDLYDQPTAENIGALPTHGTADASLSIKNHFAERPTSINIPFTDPEYQNKLTYMLATSSLAEGKPPVDCCVLSMGWDNNNFGAQLAVNMYDSARAFLRGCNPENGYSQWYEFITSLNLNDILRFKATSVTNLDIDNVDLNAIGYAKANLFGQNDGALYCHVYDNKWAHQIFGDYRTGQIAVRAKNAGTWQPWRKILDIANFKQYAMPRVPEHGNEWNFGNWSSYNSVWINFRDGLTDGKAATLIDKYILGRGNATADNNNYASLLLKDLTATGIVKCNNSYVAHELATNGTSGFIKFMQIKISGKYINAPIIVNVGGRERKMYTLSITFSPTDNHDPGISQIYKYGTHNRYDIYYVKSATSTWDFYIQKNEPYGWIDVYSVHQPQDGITITYPNTQVPTLPSGYQGVGLGGEIYYANRVKDVGNGNEIGFNYSTSGMAHTNVSWLAAWNGYTLQSVARNSFMGEIMTNNYWGLAPNGDASLWVRTPSPGIIPYSSGGRGSGHSYLGTDSWYFLNSYIDNMYGVKLDLTGGITTSLTTSTHINGAKGINVIINSTASAANSAYNMLCKMNSPNGVFNIGQYQGKMHLYYISNTKINANTNGVDKDLVLLDESGNSSFPGQVSASNFSAGGSSVFTTATIGNLTVSGSMRLKNSGNYGMKLNFGDGDYVYLHEATDDKLTIHANSGIIMDNTATFKGNAIFGNVNLKGNGSNYFDIICSDANAKAGVEYHFYSSNEYVWHQPHTDNRGYLGSTDHRWTQVYAINTAISSSDQRQKSDISYIGKESRYDSTKMSDETLIKFINGLIPCIFKRTNGESGRPHHGFVAQDVEKLMKDISLTDHAAFIKSPKIKEEETEEEYIDEDGIKKIRNIIKQKEIPGEYTYGLRYEEFISDLTRYCQILYKKNEEQEKKIHEFETRLSDIETKLYKLLNAA